MQDLERPRGKREFDDAARGCIPKNKQSDLSIRAFERNVMEVSIQRDTAETRRNGDRAVLDRCLASQISHAHYPS